jgi:hypothetical protein
MDFLQANWTWLALGVVALGWLLSRAGRGWVGRPEPDRQAGRSAGDQSEASDDHPGMTGDTGGSRRGQEARSATYSQRRGC